MLESNPTNGTIAILQPLDTGPLIATLMILCSIVLIVIIGNLLVILAIFVDRTLRKPQNMFLVSLAVVDISVGTCVLPLNIQNIVQGGWTLGRSMCKFYVTLDLTLCNMSILHLCAIALDRYRAINDGIQYIQQRTFKTTLISIGGIFILSCWISSPPVLGWDQSWMKDVDVTKKCHLLQSSGYVIYSAFGSFWFPLALMLYWYTRIYYALRRRIRERARIKSIAPGMNAMDGMEQSTEPDSSGDILDEPSQSSNANQKNGTLPKKHKKGSIQIQIEYKKKGSGVSLMSQQVQDFCTAKQKFSLNKERNAARTLGMIMGAFAVCWLPFCIMYISSPFLPVELQPSEFVFEFFTWLGYLNSGLNPIIYTVFNMEFRRAFKRILHIR